MDRHIVQILKLKSIYYTIKLTFMKFLIPEVAWLYLECPPINAKFLYTFNVLIFWHRAF